MDNVITNVESVDTEDGNALFTPAPQKPSDTSQLFPIENMSPKGGYRTFVPFDPMDVYKDNVGPSQMRPITIGEDLDKLKPVTDLRNSIQNAVEPTRAAKVIGLAKATGYDEATVEKHYDDILKTYRFQNIEAENMMFSNPVLFSQLSDRMRTEQAFKDYDQLSTAENLMNVAGTMKKQLVQGWDAGFATIEKGYRNFFDMSGGGPLPGESEEDVKNRQYELGSQIMAAELDKYLTSVGYGAGMATNSLFGSVAGSVAAIAGSMGKAGAAEAIKSGKFGAGVMILADSAVIEAGHAYEESIQRGLPEDDARTVAMVVGLINGGLELVSVAALYNPIVKGAAMVLSPAAKFALKGIGRAVGNKVIQDMAKKIPNSSSTAREMITDYFKYIGVEGVTEGSQEFVTAIGVDIGAALQKENLEVKLSTEKGRAEIAERVYGAAMTGMMSASALALVGTATHGAMHGVNSWLVNQQQKQAESDKAIVDEFVKSISRTEQFRSDKPAAADLAQRMGNEHGMPDYSLVVDEFLKTIDDEELMKNLVDVYGPDRADVISSEIMSAVEERRDARIPIKDLVMAIDTPLEEPLKSHIRMDARRITRDQAETFKKLIPDYKQIESAYMAEDEQRAMTQEEGRARTFIELYKSLGGSTKITPQSYVNEDGSVVQRSIDTLNDEDVAKLDSPNFGGEHRLALASMMTNFYEYMAKNSTVEGVTAYDVFQNAPVSFVRDSDRLAGTDTASVDLTRGKGVRNVANMLRRASTTLKEYEKEWNAENGTAMQSIDMAKLEPLFDLFKSSDIDFKRTIETGSGAETYRSVNNLSEVLDTMRLLIHKAAAEQQMRKRLDELGEEDSSREYSSIGKAVIGALAEIDKQMAEVGETGAILRHNELVKFGDTLPNITEAKSAEVAQALKHIVKGYGPVRKKFLAKRGKGKQASDYMTDEGFEQAIAELEKFIGKARDMFDAETDITNVLDDGPLTSDVAASYLGAQGYNMSGEIFYNMNTDFGSFVHEVSHHFLRSMMIHSMLRGPNNNVAADVETLIDNFIGPNDDVTTVMRDPEKYRLLQEQFAYNWQLYVFKGDSHRKKISGKLRRIFDAFSLFIKHSYEVARKAAQRVFKREYGVDLRPLTDSTKLVFDRIMSGDSLYNLARSANKVGRTFRTAEEGGMSRDEWAEYVQQELFVHNEAQAEWVADIVEKMPWLASELYRTRQGVPYPVTTSKSTRDAISEFVKSVQKTYDALEIEIRKHADGVYQYQTQDKIRKLPKEQRIGLSSVIRIYGQEVIDKPSQYDVAALVRDSAVFDSKTKSDIHDIAKSLGFKDGAELIRLWLAPQINDAYTDEFKDSKIRAVAAYGTIKAKIANGEIEPINISSVYREIANSMSSKRYSMLWSGGKEALATDEGVDAALLASEFNYQSAKHMLDEFLNLPTKDEFVAFATKRKLESINKAFTEASIQESVGKMISSEATVKKVVVEANILYKRIGVGPTYKDIWETVKKAGAEKLKGITLQEAIQYPKFEAMVSHFGSIADGLVMQTRKEGLTIEQVKTLLEQAAAAKVDQAIYLMAARESKFLAKHVSSEYRFVSTIIARASKSKVYSQTHAMEFINGIRALAYYTGFGIAWQGPTSAQTGGDFFMAKLNDSNDSEIELAAATKFHIDQWMKRPQNYSTLTVEQMKDLMRTFTMLYKTSVEEMRVSKNDEVVARRLAVDELLGATGTEISDAVRLEIPNIASRLHDATAVPPNVVHALKDLKALKPWLERPAYAIEVIQRKFTEFHTYLLRATYIAKQMDNSLFAGKLSESAHDGPWMTYIVRPVMKGLDDYRSDKRVSIKNLVDIIKRFNFNGPSVRMAFVKDDGTQIDKEFTRGELLSMLLHLGNESNMRKLIVGYNWHSVREVTKIDFEGNPKTELVLADDYYKHVLAFVQEQINLGTITYDDFKNIQNIWDNLEYLSVGFRKAYKKMTGIAWERIPRSQLMFSFNGVTHTFAGGYVPAITDKNMVNDIEIKQMILNYDIDLGVASQSAPSGAAQERILTYNRPLLLDMTAQMQHIDDILRYTHLQAPVKNAVKILLDPKMKRFFSERGDMLLEKVFLPWLTRSIRQVTITQSKAPESIDSVLNTARTRTAGIVMFLNLINALQQILGIFPTMTMVRPALLKEAAMDVLHDYSGALTNMTSLSSFMMQRVDNQFTDQADEVKLLFNNASTYQNLQQSFKKHVYILQTMVQTMIDTVVWTASYRQYIRDMGDKFTEKEAIENAIQKANETVRMTQSSLNAEDISPVEVGTPLWKLFMMFYNWFNAMYNLNRMQYMHIHKNMGGLVKNLPHTMFVFMVGFVVPFVVGDIMVRALSAGPIVEDEDDDDFIWDDYAAYMLSAAGRGALAMIPFGNAIYSGVIGPGLLSGKENAAQFNGDRIMSTPTTSMLMSSASGIRALLQYAFGDKDELSGSNIRKICQAASLFTGISVMPVCKSVGFAIDESDNFEGADYALGLAFGRVNR